MKLVLYVLWMDKLYQDETLIQLATIDQDDPFGRVLGSFLAPSKNITTYFENLIIELRVFYALNTNVKFCVNQILFTI